MARLFYFAQVLIFFLCLFDIPGISSVMMMKITNSCDDTIWPAIVSKPDSPELPKNMTGFSLLPGESKTLLAPYNWNGMVWGRNNCQSTTGTFICGTGDCSSDDVDCPRGTAVPSATTLADFSPKGGVGGYTYFVSLAKGFNLEITVVPSGNSNNNINGGDEYYCRATGCVVDLNKVCPKEVQILGQENDIIGCNSACEAFEESQDHYCGRPSTYSDNFKNFCPSAMAFEDDKTNTIFECSYADYYDINFCASSFPSTPPPFGSSRSSFPYCYSPGEEELMDNSGRSTPLVIKIVAALAGITGGGLLTMLGHAMWSHYHREDHNCPLCNLVHICICCNNWIFCNCCNHD